MGRKKEALVAKDTFWNQLRLGQGYTLVSLGAELGIDPSQLCKYFNGQVLPTTPIAVNICDKFGIDYITGAEEFNKLHEKVRVRIDRRFISVDSILMPHTRLLLINILRILTSHLMMIPLLKALVSQRGLLLLVLISQNQFTVRSRWISSWLSHLGPWLDLMCFVHFMGYSHMMYIYLCTI